MSDRWASFDCYGTLIDWEGGIGDALARLWPGRDRDALLARFHELEPQVQAGRAVSYRQVLSETLVRLAREEGLPLDEADRGALADSLPGWVPFPDVPSALGELRLRGWRIAILSNTDQDLLDASLRSIGVDVDLRVTAAEAGSYKPALGHWERFRAETSADPSRHVHVAASPFHDLAACAELGIPCVWINRLGEVTDLPRAEELPDCSGLAEALDRLLPPA